MNIFFQDFVVSLVLGSPSLLAIALYIALAFWLKSKEMGKMPSRMVFSVLVFLLVSFAFGWSAGAVLGAALWGILTFLTTRNAAKRGASADKASVFSRKVSSGSARRSDSGETGSSSSSSFDNFGGGKSGGGGATGSY